MLIVILELISHFTTIFIFASLYAVIISAFTFPIWNYIIIDYFTYLPFITLSDFFLICLNFFIIIFTVLDIFDLLFYDEEEEEKEDETEKH